MSLKEIGEFGFIKKISRGCLIRPDNIIKAIGDDAAAFMTAPDQLTLITTDLLVERIHFLREAISGFDLGYKSLAVNLSDIAAMGGVPMYAVVSLALPPDTEVADVRALYQGMIELAQRFGVAIVGGDTCRAPLVSITVTVLGSAKDKDGRMLTRSAARPGEKIAVTGALGASAAGMEMLDKKLELDAESGGRLRRAFLQPEPRVAEGQRLVALGVKAAIDISDGLISDLKHICDSSGVGARVEMERIPIAPAVRAHFSDRALELATTGGEDYELLFTASEPVIETVKAKLSCPVTVIGEVVAEKPGSVVMVDKHGGLLSLTKTGWEHFKA